MSLLATLALAASGATLPVCSWDKPGVNPFMGDVVAAVDRYQDIPSRTRDKLKARMAKRDYDEIVSIKRDGIKGQATYGGDITDMYFGQGSICRTVTRSKWTDAMEERGLVYCEDGQCILVPTVCRNVSRIRRMAPRPVAMAAATPPASSENYVAPPETELEMDPTGAGPGGASPTSFAGMTPSSLDSGLPASPGSLLPNPGGSIAPPTPILPALPVLPPGVNTPSTPSTPIGEIPPTTPAVPEPSSWALLLAGVGVLALIGSRRRRAG